MLKINDIITTQINNYGSNGEGVAKYDDYTVFVPFVVKGERVQARVDFVKNTVVYATLVEIIERSPCRVQPNCPHYINCGGCQLQHLAYEQQLLVKHNIVANNFLKLGGIDCQLLPTVPSPDVYAYRNKISLPVGGKTGNVAIGMFRQDSHDIVDLDSCTLAGEWGDKVVSVVREFINQNKLPPYNERRHTGLIRHVVARYIDNQLLVGLVINGEIRTDLYPLYQSLQKEFEQVGLFVNINTAKNNVILGKCTQHLYGIKHIENTVNGIKYYLQLDSFFQVNVKAKDLLYAKARELLYDGDTQVFIDCFSGVGLLTAYMYDDRYDSYSIEIQPSSVADAEQLKAQNNLSRLTTICGDVQVELPRLMQQLNGKHTAMIVDPPRKGLGQSICQTLIDNAPHKIVYISCDSATLARDLSMLTKVYDIAYAQPFDLFPHTRHVETIVCLKIRK